MRRSVAEPGVESEVLCHRGVRVEAQGRSAGLAGDGLGESEKGAANALSLPLGRDGDVLDQQVIRFPDQDDQADHPISFVRDEYEVLRDLLRVVLFHRTRAPANPLDVVGIGSLHKLVDVLRLTGDRRSNPHLRKPPSPCRRGRVPGRCGWHMGRDFGHPDEERQAGERSACLIQG